MTIAVSWEQANARRLRRHGLVDPVPDGDDGPQLAAIARAVGGVHAQVMSAGEVSAALRTPTATRSDVRAALWEDRNLVKTFGPRGTVHLLPAADLPVWTAVLSDVPHRNPFPDGVRIDDQQTDAVVAAIDVALADDDLTVDELSAAVVAATGPWAGEEVMPAFGGMWPRWRQVLHTAGHRGVLCFGPDRGRRVTYASPRRWRPDLAPADVATARRDLLHRYLHAYGPARPVDLARWLGTPASWATAAFAEHAGEEVDLDGTTAWVAPGDTAFADEPVRGVRLLPYFDAFVVGSQPRARLFPGRAAGRALVPSGQAGNYAVVLVDGTVGGVWHQKRSGRRVALTVELLRDPLVRHRRALDAEVDRLGAIVEATPSLTLGPVTVGPHA